MLPNERFALECRARYEEMGLVVDEKNGEFAHCPLPKKMGDKGYYLLHDDHQHQGLLQSRDVGRCCFLAGDAKRWLINCKELPEGYFELWDIYEEYVKDHVRKINKKLHAEKDERGKSVHAVKAGTASNAKRTREERVAIAKKAGKVSQAKRTQEEKVEIGRKVMAILNAERDESGRSVNAVESGKKGGVATHAEKDEMGRSLHALKLHAEKDEDGKSLLGKKCGKAAHAKKDEKGESVTAKKAGAAAKLVCQKKVEVTRISDKVTFVFESGMDACRSLNLNSSGLSAVCNGKRESTKGYTARYI